MKIVIDAYRLKIMEWRRVTKWEACRMTIKPVKMMLTPRGRQVDYSALFRAPSISVISVSMKRRHDILEMPRPSPIYFYPIIASAHRTFKNESSLLRQFKHEAMARLKREIWREQLQARDARLTWAISTNNDFGEMSRSAMSYFILYKECAEAQSPRFMCMCNNWSVYNNENSAVFIWESDARNILEVY